MRIPSTSVDALDARLGGLARIGFIHLDVEGFEQKAVEAAQRVIRTHRPIIVTERHTEKFNDTLILQHGYHVAQIPEICGAPECRNYLWVPGGKWEASMGVVGKELARPLVAERSPRLDEVGS